PWAKHTFLSGWVRGVGWAWLVIGRRRWKLRVGARCFGWVCWRGTNFGGLATGVAASAGF
ncbi:MAG: hypothetical protein WCE62_01015, partial [Polyangiales bacterium]